MIQPIRRTGGQSGVTMGLSPSREGSTTKRHEEVIDGPIASALLIFPLLLPTVAGRVGPGKRRFCLLKMFTLEVNEALEAGLWLSAAPQDQRPKRK